MIVTATLAALLARCAPSVGPVTMGALVAYESGGRAWAIDDDTARRAYFPATRPEAVATALRLVRAGHVIDVGYAQLKRVELRGVRTRRGLRVRTVRERRRGRRNPARRVSRRGAALRSRASRALPCPSAATTAAATTARAAMRPGVFRMAGSLRAERIGAAR